MLASTIQFTTNPPTPGSHHPHKAAEHGPGNQGALPQNPDSMPPPHAHKHAGAPTTTQQAAAGVSLMPAPDKPTTRENKPTRHGRPPSLPQGQTPQPAQTHSTIQTTHGQEATPHNQSLERR